MNLRAIIPVKSLDAGKGRLATILGPAERRDLNRELLDHMLALTAVFPGATRTIVTSADRDVLDRAEAAGAEALLDATGDLNAALADAARHAAAGDAEGVLIVPVDLPHAAPEDLVTMVSRGHGVAIAPDRHGIGTNALFVAPPRGFTFRFGENSFEDHVTEARNAGLAIDIARLPNLAFDVDTPEDFREWRRTASPARRATG